MGFREAFIKLTTAAAVILAVAQGLNIANNRIQSYISNIGTKLAAELHLPGWFLVFTLGITFTYITYRLSVRTLNWLIPTIWAFIFLWWVLYEVGIIPLLSREIL